MPHLDEFGLQDTTPEMQEKIYELLRQLTPAQRLQMVIDRMAFTRNKRANTEHLRSGIANRPLNEAILARQTMSM